MKNYEYLKILPERLKYYRTKYGKTQEEIAEELKISQSTYGNYEAGNRKPSIEMIAKIADIYETSIDNILGRTDINETKWNTKKTNSAG